MSKQVLVIISIGHIGECRIGNSASYTSLAGIANLTVVDDT